MDGRFQVIEQAMVSQRNRDAARATCAASSRDEASGFAVDALRRSNQGDAAVAPAASG
jgi:hypothetical protein